MRRGIRRPPLPLPPRPPSPRRLKVKTEINTPPGGGRRKLLSHCGEAAAPEEQTWRLAGLRHGKPIWLAGWWASLAGSQLCLGPMFLVWPLAWMARGQGRLATGRQVAFWHG